MSFTPKSRLEKILCGVSATAKTRIEKAVEAFMNGRFFDVAGTIGVNAQEKQTITANVTAEEAYEATAAGKTIRMTVPLAEGYEAHIVVEMSATRVQSGSTVTYAFRMENEEGIGFSSGDLAGDATLVLTEE